MIRITNLNYVFVLQKLSLQYICIFKFSKLKIVIEIWELKVVLLKHNAHISVLYFPRQFYYMRVMFYPLSVLLRALKALTYKLILVLLCVDECRVLQKKSEIKVQGYSN